MTRLIGIDTSTWWGGIALIESTSDDADPALVAQLGLRVPDSHAIHLVQALEWLLTRVGWSKHSVGAFVATRGPGSFTGIRVGLGTIRGLALATGRPCLGVGTLEAMAEALGPMEADRVPLLDAGRGEVYGARFDAASSPPLTVVEPWVGPPQRAVADPPAVVFGPGARHCAERLARAGRTHSLRRTPVSVAAGAARLGRLRLNDALAAEVDMAPLYLRPPDAELKSG